MTADLTAIRALLASLERDMYDSDEDDRMRLDAAAPTLHAHLTDLADEVARLRAEVERLQEPGSVMMAHALLDLAAGEVDDG